MENLLVIAPHPDDEVLGAGGIIRKISEKGGQVTVLTVSGHLPPLYSKKDYDTTISEAAEAHQKLGVNESIYLEIPATTVSSIPIHELNGQIADVVQKVRPQIVLLPYPDRHVDHRAIFDSALVSCRPNNSVGANIKTLAAYETLSETHWNAPHIEPNFTPNWTVDISDQIDKKLEALACFKSQILPHPNARSIEATRALSVFRGSQVGQLFGESFHIIRKID